MPARLQVADNPQMTVRPSAVLELMWLCHNCEADQPLLRKFASQETLRLRFRDSLHAFWDDGVRGFTEVIVLGKHSGTLFDADLDLFLARLDETAKASRPRPSLLSEPPEEQEPLRARLARLRSDTRLRRDYHDLLEAVWAAAKSDWETNGRAAVIAERHAGRDE